MAIGEQLELPFEGGLPGCSMPWEGCSPRALTRVAMSRIFKAQAVKKRERFDLSGQLDFWMTDEKGPVRSHGAPLLIEPRRSDGGPIRAW